MVGISRSKTTYYKYRCVYKHLENYVNDKFNRKDIAVQRTRQTVPRRSSTSTSHGSRGHKKNTAWVYMIAFKHILMLARSRGLHGRGPLRRITGCAANSWRATTSPMTEIRRLMLSGHSTDRTLSGSCATPSCSVASRAFPTSTSAQLTPAAYPAGRQTAVDQHHPPQNRICGQRAHLRDTVHHSAEIQTDAAECADIPPAEQRLVQHLPATALCP